ncbi:hypothetical protein BpHYR1_019630 [Brachionus plicatilis]|uniref:Uncharacterized protein n=1 Tax=Brachionus plicatilis TaxID=10195 RepID=A0A3M7QE73_BRAPC|nr:hypothetical protein BpHYR1_019630 [Brachionus plicatilis]
MDIVRSQSKMMTHSVETNVLCEEKKQRISTYVSSQISCLQSLLLILQFGCVEHEIMARN